MTKSFDRVMRGQSAKLIKIVDEIVKAASGNSDDGSAEAAYESLSLAAQEAKAVIEASKATSVQEGRKKTAIGIMMDLAVAGKAGAIGSKNLDEGGRLITLSIATIRGAIPLLEEWKGG